MFKIRDKEAFILFIIGFGLSFFIVLNGYHLLNAWFTQMIKTQSEASYQNHIQFTAVTNVPDERQQTIEESINERQQTMPKADKLLHLLSKQNETTYIKSITLPIGSASQYENTNIILSYNEEWYRTLQAGHYPTKEQVMNHKKHYVVISESAQTYVEQSNEGDYIKINGEKYFVTGVFENYQASGYDMEISFFYLPDEGYQQDIIHERIIEHLINGWPLDICLGSNTKDVSDTAQNLMNIIKTTFDCSVDISDYSTDDSIAQFYSGIKALVLGILFFVSILNCMQITKLWMVRKQKELIILKTYGFANYQIVGRIVTELVQMMLISFLCVAILDIFYMINTTSIQVSPKTYFQNAFLLLIAFVIIITLTMAPIIESVKKIEPAIGLREL